MSGYQVGPETFVTLRFTVFDAEGEQAAEPDVLATVFGMGGLLPRLEQALEGKREGDVVEVVLEADDAFGRRAASGILEVDRGEFPPDVSPGDRLELENEQGGLLVAHVLDVQDEIVVLDTNHPLADQDVKFRLEIQEVRPATGEEIVAQEEQMNEDVRFLQADVPDISPSSLIRGRTRG